MDFSEHELQSLISQCEQVIILRTELRSSSYKVRWRLSFVTNLTASKARGCWLISYKSQTSASIKERGVYKMINTRIIFKMIAQKTHGDSFMCFELLIFKIYSKTLYNYILIIIHVVIRSVCVVWSSFFPLKTKTRSLFHNSVPWAVPEYMYV